MNSIATVAGNAGSPKSEERWERAVPVYGFPVVTRFFLVLVALTMVALVLTGYRELAGLGPVSGMNDAYGWGIWKTFNVMVLTALGSGAFAVGIAAWVFRRKKLHALMRMALLTSFLAYACGLLLLGIDAGRPWNFYWTSSHGNGTCIPRSRKSRSACRFTR